LAGCGTALGAGFALLEQSAKELGSAFAGGAAAAEDAGTIFFNPAGLSRIPGGQVVGAAHGIFPVARFQNEGSVDRTGAPLTGGNSGNAVKAMPVPALYFSRQLNDRVHVGLGIFSPFGLSTNYETTWVGRYHALKSDLVTLNFNPCVAYRFDDHLSVAVGLDVQYAKAKLSSAIDFSGILGYAGVPGLLPQQSDGMVMLTGDSWGVGYNAGVLYQFTPGTRVGVAYRSRIDHTLEGSSHFSNVPVPSARFQDSGVKADLTVPDSASFSVWHNVTKDFAVTADATWTHWALFNELRVKFDNPAASDTVTTTNWENTWRFALGLIYTPGPWTFRAGTAYDESPIPSSGYRTPRIPDSDRIWAAVGVGYKFSDALSADLGYAHLFVRDPTIAKPINEENFFRGALAGTYEAHVDIVGAQFAWSFR